MIKYIIDDTFSDIFVTDDVELAKALVNEIRNLTCQAIRFKSKIQFAGYLKRFNPTAIDDNNIVLVDYKPNIELLSNEVLRYKFSKVLG